MIKKIFVISSIIFLILGSIFFVFKFLANKDKKENKKIVANNEIDQEELGEINEKISINTNTNTNTNTKEEDDDGSVIKKNPNFKINKFIEGEINSAKLSKETEELFYNNGKNFLKTSLNGKNRTSLVSYPFNRIDFIDWSENLEKALIKDSDKYLLADFTKGEINEINVVMDWAILNRYGDGLVIKYYDKKNKERKVNNCDLASLEQKEIAVVDEKMIEMKLNPVSNQVLIFPTPDALKEARLYLADLTKKDKKTIFQGKLGANFLWSPKGSKILFSYTLDNDKSTTNLGVINKDGGEFNGLNFPGLVEKCVWADDEAHIYCAAMTDVPVDMVMPNDWLNGKFENVDSFWKINIKDGKKERIVSLDELGKTGETYDGYNFLFDNDKRSLFFINKKDKDLYQIDL